jgi:hypothetical protein
MVIHSNQNPILAILVNLNICAKEKPPRCGGFSQPSGICY